MPQLVEDVSGLMFTMCLCNRWSETNGFLRRLTGTTFAIDGSLMHVILSSKRGELVMSGKQLLFKSAAREKLLRGASVLADAVRVTLGPRSKCVLIQKKFGRPLVCKGSYGFDAATGKYTDLLAAGIIDPTKVVRMALENAVSVAGVLLLTEATLTEIPDSKSHEHPGGMPEP